MAEDVTVISDGGGEVVAALNPIIGSTRGAVFMAQWAERSTSTTHVSLRILNGLPGLVLDLPDLGRQFARRAVLRIDVNSSGQIAAIHNIMATSKLTAI